MEKRCQDKNCLYKCHRDIWNLLKMVPGTFLQSLVKIVSVSAEIFLIWTNVARTNVAWTNVPVIVKSVQDGPRKLSIKFGQNRFSNSWDIADIEFEVVLLRVGRWVSEIEFEVELRLSLAIRSVNVVGWISLVRLVTLD